MTTSTGHVYLLSNPLLGTSWIDAEQQAIALGGHLVTINTASENQWLINAFGTAEGFWIGLTDADNEGTFQWSSGEPVTYTNWAVNEPNGTFSNEDYGELNPLFAPGQWNDRPSYPDNIPHNRGRGIIEIVGRVTGTPSDDLILARGGDVVMSGGAGNDTLYGDEGSDRLSGNSGNDLLYGQGGNDTFIGGTGQDTIDGGAGNDTVNYQNEERSNPMGAFLGFSIALTSGQVAPAFSGLTPIVEDTLSNIENVTGSQFADFIVGNDSNNRLVGSGGNDTIRGLGGRDTIDGGDGSDTVTYQNERRTNSMGAFLGFSIALTSGQVAPAFSGLTPIVEDTLSNIENVTGSQFADFIVGNDSNNRLVGSGGDDTLRGLGGQDVMDGGGGNDTVTYQNERRTSSMGAFLGFSIALSNGQVAPVFSGISPTVEDTLVRVEHVVGSQFADFIVGNDSDNRLTSSGGNDTLYGLGGSDRLSGGNGNDRLDGGLGDDIISTGSGQDIVILRQGQGCDRFTDFQDGQDKIDLIGISYRQLTFAEQSGHVLVNINGATILKIEDTALTEISRADFI